MAGGWRRQNRYDLPLGAGRLPQLVRPSMKPLTSSPTESVSFFALVGLPGAYSHRSESHARFLGPPYSVGRGIKRARPSIRGSLVDSASVILLGFEMVSPKAPGRRLRPGVRLSSPPQPSLRVDPLCSDRSPLTLFVCGRLRSRTGGQTHLTYGSSKEARRLLGRPHQPGTLLVPPSRLLL